MLVRRTSENTPLITRLAFQPVFNRRIYSPFSVGLAASTTVCDVTKFSFFPLPLTKIVEKV